MPPAIRPPWSWSWPRVEETDTTWPCLNFSGSAPYLSWSARSVADCWLKLPEILALPPGMASSIVGATMTTPSSTLASRLRGGCRLVIRRVTSANCEAPLDLKLIWTIHSPVVWSVPAVAPEISVPCTTALSRMYRSLPSLLQATYGFAGSSWTPWPRFFALQSMSRNCFCTSSPMPVRSCPASGSSCCCGGADGAAEGAGDLPSLADSDAAGDGAVFVRADDSARPAGVALALGTAFAL